MRLRVCMCVCACAYVRVCVVVCTSACTLFGPCACHHVRLCTCPLPFRPRHSSMARMSDSSTPSISSSAISLLLGGSLSNFECQNSPMRSLFASDLARVSKARVFPPRLFSFSRKCSFTNSSSTRFLRHFCTCEADRRRPSALGVPCRDWVRSPPLTADPRTRMQVSSVNRTGAQVASLIGPARVPLARETPRTSGPSRLTRHESQASLARCKFVGGHNTTTIRSRVATSGLGKRSKHLFRRGPRVGLGWAIPTLGGQSLPTRRPARP